MKSAFHAVGAIPYDDILIQTQKNEEPEGPPFFMFGYEEHSDVRALLSKAAAQCKAQLPNLPLIRKLPQKTILKPGRNLQALLIRASVTKPPRTPKGCSNCASESCRLHDTEMIVSVRTGIAYKIKSSTSCTPGHVAYVITFKRCGVQGAGACATPLTRLPTYIHALD